MKARPLSLFDYVTGGFVVAEIIFLLLAILDAVGIKVFGQSTNANGAEFVLGLLTALATLLAVLVAYRAYTHAAQVASDERVQARIREQAYIHADAAWLERSEDGLYCLQFRFINSGQTPALHFGFAATARTVPRREASAEPFPQFNEEELKHWAAIGGQGDTRTARWRREESSFTGLLGGRLAASKVDREATVILVMGVVSYQTIYGETFDTEFAFFIDDVKQAYERLSRSTNVGRTFAPRAG